MTSLYCCERQRSFPSDMYSISRYFAILLLSCSIIVASGGHFFTISKYDQSVKNTEPFLSSGVFRCSEETSCTTAVSNRKSNVQNDDSNPTVITMHKTKDPSTKYSSCRRALLVNGDREGYYHIQHGSMLQSVEVECKLINQTAYSIFHHDSEASATVTGYEEPGSFRKEFKYQLDLKDVITFVDSSTFCRQWTRFDCKHSFFLTSPPMRSYLVDRSSLAMMYIGGGPTNKQGCKCGITNTCTKSGTLCNCDINDYVWRHDEGYVTDSRRLPLTEVRIGDTGDNHEAMRYTIGPVECLSEI